MLIRWSRNLDGRLGTITADRLRCSSNRRCLNIRANSKSRPSAVLTACTTDGCFKNRLHDKNLDRVDTRGISIVLAGGQSMDDPDFVRFAEGSEVLVARAIGTEKVVGNGRDRRSDPDRVRAAHVLTSEPISPMRHAFDHAIKLRGLFEHLIAASKMMAKKHAELEAVFVPRTIDGRSSVLGTGSA